MVISRYVCCGDWLDGAHERTHQSVLLNQRFHMGSNYLDVDSDGDHW